MAALCTHISPISSVLQSVGRAPIRTTTIRAGERKSIHNYHKLCLYIPYTYIHIHTHMCPPPPLTHMYMRIHNNHKLHLYIPYKNVHTHTHMCPPLTHMYMYKHVPMHIHACTPRIHPPTHPYTHTYTNTPPGMTMPTSCSVREVMLPGSSTLTTP